MPLLPDGVISSQLLWRWVQRYAPELNKRCRREMKPTNGSWRVDETYICQGGNWRYLYRAVDSTGATIDFGFLLSETRLRPSSSSRKPCKLLVIPGRESSP